LAVEQSNNYFENIEKRHIYHQHIQGTTLAKWDTIIQLYITQNVQSNKILNNEENTQVYMQSYDNTKFKKNEKACTIKC